MENPFAFSNYVTGEAFCNRKKELAELMRSMNWSQNVLLYSHRRLGKSSLIRQAFHQINEQKENIGVMHVDL
jgi:predicted AAA+ superfamily ATPase